MSEVYRQLAKHLDSLPAGFPATASGVELRILKRLFTPEEAQTALHLTMQPETAEEIARRMGKAPAPLADLLDRMSRKGLIYRRRKGDQTQFMAAQFVIGIWEYHLNDLDAALIKDMNEYLPTLMQKAWLTRDTKQLRVVPVARSISADMAVMLYEIAEKIIQSQSKIVVSPCICRKEHQMVGNGCDNPIEVCFAFGGGAAYYEENGLGREVSPQKALQILSKGLEAGLVLQPGNAQKPSNICMCCGCCCQVLKNLKTLERPAQVVHTNYFAQIDPQACTGCETCVDRCHMEAIQINDAAQVLPHRCIGCGLCVTTCPEKAIRLHQKEEKDRYVPPGHTVQTFIRMAKERNRRMV